MVDYEKKYLDLTTGFMKCIEDISDEFPKATGFDKAVIALRRKGWNYGDIQRKLGMPSKKEIRAALLKWSPELIDNSKTKIVKVVTPENELYIIIKNNDKKTFNIDGDTWTFFIENNKLSYTDKLGTWEFSDWDENTQAQILEQIKEQLNDS